MEGELEDEGKAQTPAWLPLLLLLLLQLVLRHNWLPYSIFLAPFQLPGVIEGEATCSVQISKTTSDGSGSASGGGLCCKGKRFTVVRFIWIPFLQLLRLWVWGKLGQLLHCNWCWSAISAVQFGRIWTALFVFSLYLFICCASYMHWVSCPKLYANLNKVAFPGGSIMGLHIYKSSCWI